MAMVRAGSMRRPTTARIGSMLIAGVGGADDDAVSFPESLRDARRRFRLFRPDDLDRRHRQGVALADEVLLQVEASLRGRHLGADRLLRHRDHLGLEAEPPGQVGGDRRGPQTGAEEVGPQDMGGQVPVAEPEPGLLAIALEHLEHGEGFAVDAPVGLLVEDPRQPVENRVGIRADRQAPELEVVPGVGDHRQRARRKDPVQPFGEHRPAGAPCEEGDFQLASVTGTGPPPAA